MTLALRTPALIENIVSVDNAPLDAAIPSDFAKYIQGMRKIEESEVIRQAEADKILQDHEEASPNQLFPLSHPLLIPVVCYNTTIPPWQPLSITNREDAEVQDPSKNLGYSTR
jgi:hypothetical protein